ncbi:MAG: hypothetical protein ACLUFV_05710 [Acutalibacteraceae bacterium]
MKIRLIISAVLFLGNAYVTHLLWDVWAITTLPVCFLILSYLCTLLFMFNIRNSLLRTITYTLNVAVFLLGIAYAIYYRNPLGFYTSFTATVLFAKNFIAGPDRKDKTIAKVANILVLSALSAALVITGIAFIAALRNPFENGAGVQWNEAAERKFYEVASGSTDEEKVQSAYTFITENFTYGLLLVPRANQSHKRRALLIMKTLLLNILVHKLMLYHCLSLAGRMHIVFII